jgi:tripartite-type tricarboxylate transporter receptor subunit TctC
MAYWKWTRGAIVLAVVVVTLRLELLPGGSDSYPNRPITLVIPFAPGGESDFFGRALQKAIREHNLLPVEIVIQNVQGAGATIGSGRVRRAAPDGYTMLLLHEALITAQSSGKVSYGPEDFEPIAATGKLSMIIAVRNDSPFQTLGALMEEAAKRPNELIFAANLNAPVHYAGLILESNQPGAAFLYTQIGGGAHRYEALVGGHADVSAFSMGEFIDYRAGGIRALAVSSAERHPSAPEIMTAVEQGYDFVHANMHFWWFPQGTDQAKVDYMAGVIQKAMATEQVQKALAKRLCEPLVKTGEEMKSLLVERIRAIRSVDATSPDVLPNIPLWISLATLLSLVLAVLGHRARALERVRQAETELDPVGIPAEGDVTTPGQDKKALDAGTEGEPGQITSIQESNEMGKSEYVLLDESRFKEDGEVLNGEIPAGYFLQVLLFSALTLAYLSCLVFLELDFRIPTVLFMTAMVYLVRRREPKVTVWKGFPWDICILVPLVVHLVFHVFLQVELP